MDNTISILHSAADFEVVTLEEQEDEELSQALQHMNSQIQLEPGRSFDSFSEPTGCFPIETASAPTMAQSSTTASVTAHALDRRPGALSGENGASGASGAPHNEEAPAGKSALARDKQFSSSPNDEASLVIRPQRSLNPSLHQPMQMTRR
jgi:hypothetical protein